MLSHNYAVKREGRMLHFHTAQHKKQRQKVESGHSQNSTVSLIRVLAAFLRLNLYCVVYL
jgi:hypothetical protein